MSDAIERLAIESLRQAADEITRLRAENDSLLGMVVDVAEYPDGASHGITLGELIAKHQAEVAELREQVVVVEAQLDHERKGRAFANEQLAAIYALLYPPPMPIKDGRSMVFKPQNIDPHEVLQELSDRIRAVPYEIARIANRLDARMPGEER